MWRLDFQAVGCFALKLGSQHRSDPMAPHGVAEPKSSEASQIFVFVLVI